MCAQARRGGLGAWWSCARQPGSHGPRLPGTPRCDPGSHLKRPFQGAWRLKHLQNQAAVRLRISQKPTGCSSGMGGLQPLPGRCWLPSEVKYTVPIGPKACCIDVVAADGAAAPTGTCLLAARGFDAKAASFGAGSSSASSARAISRSKSASSMPSVRPSARAPKTILSRSCQVLLAHPLRAVGCCCSNN